MISGGIRKSFKRVGNKKLKTMHHENKNLFWVVGITICVRMLE